MTGEEEKIAEFIKYKPRDVVLDKDENLVFLAQTAYVLQMAKSNNPDITFHETSEFKVGGAE
jgi:peptide chain release factor 3